MIHCTSKFQSMSKTLFYIFRREWEKKEKTASKSWWAEFGTRKLTKDLSRNLNRLKCQAHSLQVLLACLEATAVKIGHSNLVLIYIVLECMNPACISSRPTKLSVVYIWIWFMYTEKVYFFSKNTWEISPRVFQDQGTLGHYSNICKCLHCRLLASVTCTCAKTFAEVQKQL